MLLVLFVFFLFFVSFVLLVMLVLFMLLVLFVLMFFRVLVVFMQLFFFLLFCCCRCCCNVVVTCRLVVMSSSCRFRVVFVPFFYRVFFICIMGELIGACFNNTNEKITHWRMKHVNHSKFRRFVEVICVSSLFSIISFALPYVLIECKTLPEATSERNSNLIETLVKFGCEKGKEYNELALLIFT